MKTNEEIAETIVNRLLDQIKQMQPVVDAAVEYASMKEIHHRPLMGPCQCYSCVLIRIADTYRKAADQEKILEE